MRKPVYLLAGGPGGGSTLSAMSRALGECGKPKPRVAYIGTASRDNFLFFTAIKAQLHKAGAGDVVLVRLAKKSADISGAKKRIETCDAVFISGGEVDDGMRWLERHGMIAFLREQFDGGKFFFGVSAGSIMLGAHWAHWAHENDDATAVLINCLGFVPVTFDTHAEDEDWRELVTVLRLLGPGARGWGIPSGGAALYDADGRLAALEGTLLPYFNDGGLVKKAGD